MKVSNMVSNRTGKEVANQFSVEDDYGNIYFQSYKSIIVKVSPDNKTLLDSRFWNYSKTTGKYRNQFLGESRTETEAKIKSGEYLLADLNS